VERTTPEAIDLQATFREMLDAGDAACAMEVSSHALSLHRADAIHLAAGVFTNLTQDHLDFHGTIEEYFSAKRKLFTLGRGARTAVAVVNLDDRFGRDLADELRAAGHSPVVTFGIEGAADFTAGRVSYGARGSQFTCTGPDGSAEASMPLPGLFNVYNALGAIAAASALGVSLPRAAAALREAPRVPGRFEPVDEGQEFTLLVDYAHTPDSVENVLNAGREVLGTEGGGRLICVLGAGGDRDREKRPLMGAIARRLSDVVVITSDNPRSEDPAAIIADIVRGADEEGESRMEVEPDRRKAIEKAVELAEAGDLVIVAGKGHEQGQEFENGRKIPFDDREVAREALKALDPVHSG
jgi:UDP-N-acetylmuramoyl-L-alanyl-D-glutamate--2,6-diaminopimelate ligase